MANIKSAKKRVLISTKKHDRNRIVRSAVKTRIVRVRRITDGGESAPEDQLREAIASLDRAAERGIIHANNAARRKSREGLAANLRRGTQADPEVAAAQAAAEARSRAKRSGKVPRPPPRRPRPKASLRGASAGAGSAQPSLQHQQPQSLVFIQPSAARRRPALAARRNRALFQPAPVDARRLVECL